MELGQRMKLKNLLIFFSSNFLHYDSTSSFADKRNHIFCPKDVTAAEKKLSLF